MLGNPSIADFVAHHALLYDDLRDPVALLRGQTTTKLSQFWPYAEDRPGQPSRTGSAGEDRDGRYAAYSDLMAAVAGADRRGRARRRSPDALHAVFSTSAAAKACSPPPPPAARPTSKLKLFDLPAGGRARETAAHGRLGSKAACEPVGGSFLTDPLPEGADIVSLVRVLHDHDDESALAILRARAPRLHDGGSVLIAEPMAETPGAEPIGDAYFGFYLLAMGRGRARSAEAHRRTPADEPVLDPLRTLITPRPLLASRRDSAKSVNFRLTYY